MITHISKKEMIAVGTLLVEFDIKLDFKPGQYIVLRIPGVMDDKSDKRIFSLINDPSKNATIATRMSESGFKQKLSTMSIGDEVEILSIGGKFILPEDRSKHIVFLAGGIGITPFISMLRHVKKDDLDYNITLIYSNRDKSASAFLNELNNTCDGLVCTMTDDPTWDGEKRKIDQKFISDHVPDFKEAIFMVVGPPGMVKAMQTIFDEMGISEVIVESFGGY